MRKGKKSIGRMKEMRPVDWWRAGVWITRAAREQRAVRRLKRVDTNAEKTEVSPTKNKGVGRPKKAPA